MTENLIYGLIAVAAGALFCFRGARAFHIIIPAWGAFVGFTLGAGLVGSITGTGFLRTGLAWLVGLGLAVCFALLAYFFFEVAVVLAMGSIGFALGASLVAALGISWTWVIVLTGVALGGLLAVAALIVDLPMILLVILSAMGGASAIVTGLMLLVGEVTTRQFTDAAVTARVDHIMWWYLLYVTLVVAGSVAQLWATERVRISMRDSWVAAPVRA